MDPDTQDFHLGPKRGSIVTPQNCSHPDLRGLVGTLFGSIFGENWSGVAVLKKWPFFLWSKGRFLAVFHQIWTSEGPNVVKIPNTRISDPLPVTFLGGKFWYHDKKKLAHFWARREARFAICPFFLRKNIFSARVVFRPSRTAKKAAKRTRVGFRNCGSALATLLPLLSPGVAILPG